MKYVLTIVGVLACAAALRYVTLPEARTVAIEPPPHPNVVAPPDGCTAEPSGLLHCTADYGPGAGPCLDDPIHCLPPECKGSCID